MKHLALKLAALVSLALLSGALLPACSSANPKDLEPEATERLQATELGLLPRVHTLGGIFLAGGQPSAEDLSLARQGGMRTVIDMRKPAEERGFDEAATVRDLDMEYVSLPWNGPDELTDEVFQAGRGLFARAQRPMLVHCGSANRVGAVWVAWRTLDGGIDLEQAVTEAKTIGLRTPAYEQKAREYVSRNR